MGKRKNKRNISNILLRVLVVILTLVLATMVWVAVLFEQTNIPFLSPLVGEPSSTTQPSHAQQTTPSVPETQNDETQNDETQNDGMQNQEEALALTDGLQLLHISSYAGIYMEDGSDEPVSDVMMIILQNTSQKDLQLARISITYPSFVAEFEVTNLPAGEKVVALEKNRHPASNEEYNDVTVKNVAFFNAPMSLNQETIRISGQNGLLDVTNISDEDIAGEIYIYYKNSADDLLYGGITYRVVVKGGLPAGKSVRAITGHYVPGSSRIVSVVIGA